MTTSDKVIWSEGMFLQPQHFQQHDRYIENLVMRRPCIHEFCNFGISECQFDQQLLSIGKISIHHCRGFFSDGTAFSIPEMNHAPLILDVPEGTANCIIYLALPFKRAGISECGTESENALFRYQTKTVQVCDSNINATNVVPVQVGKLALQLILETQDRQGLNCLGIARILELDVNKEISLDENYIPPCINAKSISYLSNLVQEIQGLLQFRGKVLAQRISDISSGARVDIIEYLVLNIINKSESLFEHLLKIPSVHPEYLFSVSIQLLAELSTFANKQHRPENIPLYLHEDLKSSFHNLAEQLRNALRTLLKENVAELKINWQESGIWDCTLPDKTFIDKVNFILGVKAALPRQFILSHFPGQIKIAPPDEIQNLINRSLPGIELEHLPVIPGEIPYFPELTYFVLNMNHAFWKPIKNSGSIVFHLGGEYPEIQLALWTTVKK